MEREREEPLDTQLGYEVSATAFDRLFRIWRTLEDRGLAATRGKILDRLIKEASADELAPHFPPLPPKRRRRRKTGAG